jgi:hypothetical protein
MPKRGLAVGLVLASVACTGMRRIEPAQFIPAHKPERVSVWTTAHNVTVVSYPQIDGDTLRGVVFADSWAMPLKNVVKMEVKAPDLAKTWLLLAGATASAVGMYLLSTSGHAAASVPCEPDLPPEQKAYLCGGPSQ